MANGSDLKLGAILLRMEYVHEEHIQEALDLQGVRQKRIGELLMEMGYVEEDHILQALSEQFGIPFETDVAQSADAELTTKVPINFIRENEMVPFRENGEAVHVAVHDPVNLLPLDDLRLLLNNSVKPILCRKKDIQDILDTYFDQQSVSATDMIETIAGDEENVYSLDTEPSERDLLDLANEAPIIKLINLMISGAVKERASDIHVRCCPSLSSNRDMESC